MKTIHLLIVSLIGVAAIIIGAFFIMNSSEDESETQRYIAVKKVSDINIVQEQFPSVLEAIETIGTTISTNESEFEHLLDYLDENSVSFVK